MANRGPFQIDPDMTRDIVRNIRQFRLDAGKTLPESATAGGIGPRMLSTIEGSNEPGRTPTPPNIVTSAKLCAFYGRSLDDLVRPAPSRKR